MTRGGWIDHLAQAIGHGDPALVGAGVFLGAAGAALAAWRAWRDLRNARLIGDTPTAKTRSAPQGYVELEGAGRLIDGPPIVAPLSGLPCVWYRYRVEEQVTSFEKRLERRRWKTVDHGASTETFWLEDDTGRVIVDPEGADVTPRHKDVWTARSPQAGIARRTPYLIGFLASPASANPYRLTEERINPGERLYVLGQLRNLGAVTGASTVDEELRSLLQEWKRNQDDLKRRFDLNHDGNIDQTEWMLARAQARREVLKARRENTKSYGDGLNIVTHTGDRDRPYLLSAYSQADLLRRYRLRTCLYVLGFFVLGSAALWMFNLRFG